MSEPYTPPKVWTWQNKSGGQFASINRPDSGVREEKQLPKGEHPYQLYSLATPNGIKTTILLEELIEAGVDIDYDAWIVNIMEGKQFTSGFVDINPNSKIPAFVDYSTAPPTSVFESGSILLYLAEKHKMFIPENHNGRTEVLNWLFWQVGAGPYLGGGFGHFYAYAPSKIEYCIDRFTMEVKRQLDLLDKKLASTKYIAGDQYTIADMAILPWYGGLVKNRLYNAAEFVGAQSYKNLMRWTEELFARPAVKRGEIVNKSWGEGESKLPERHSKKDFQGIDL